MIDYITGARAAWLAGGRAGMFVFELITGSCGSVVAVCGLGGEGEAEDQDREKDL